MKNLTKILTFLLAAVCLFNSCKNPASEMNIIFDADVIKYKATLILKTSTGGSLPDNVNITVEGPDAAGIYDFSGTKKIYAPAGIVTIGVAPKSEPTATKDLAFDVLITAPGYEDKRIPMTILFNQFQQIVNVTLLKTLTPSPASTVRSVDAKLSPTGATTDPVIVTTPTSATVEETTTITIPAGVTFKDANGNAVTGSTLTARAVNFDPEEPAALALFPGGQLIAPNVQLPTGGTGEAFFLPAGFADIQMFVGGVEVKQFSNPIAISIQVDPSFTPRSTSQPIKVGDELSIYSYSPSDGQFKYEGMGEVITDGTGKLAVSFQTTHLTIFIVGDVVPKPATCAVPQITFSAPWMNTGTAPMTVEIWNDAGTKLLASEQVIVSNGKIEPFDGLPSFGVRYKVLYTNGQLLAEGAISEPCSGGNITIVLGEPNGTPIQNVSLLIGVNCPGVGPIVVPNFTLFYREHNKGNFEILGTAEKGALQTTLLKVGTEYDFRATWGSQTKTVIKRMITELDNSAVVDEEGFLGGNAADYNRKLLIEACKNR
ncbi:hypothetical protein [Pedobacter deserti]|uniref:hypothetical protein n=1 Tax=Pedobacter deserti TaxID=2817382 RepID=UPI00210C57A3|nr:hypothetical protein [Pedobacter sp. SYSU D00382]